MDNIEMKVKEASELIGTCEHCGGITFDSGLPQKRVDSLNEIWIGRVHSPRLMVLCDECLKGLNNSISKYLEKRKI